MFITKAYAAQSATSALAQTEITRRMNREFFG